MAEAVGAAASAHGRGRGHNLPPTSCLPSPAPPMQTIADIQNDFKPPTMAIQNTYRFLPIASALCCIAALGCYSGHPVLPSQHIPGPALLCGGRFLNIACPFAALANRPPALPPCRDAPAAVLFGILIGVVVAALVAVWYMTWPRTCAVIVAILW